jgi:hypothetical protein
MKTNNIINILINYILIFIILCLIAYIIILKLTSTNEIKSRNKINPQIELEYNLITNEIDTMFIYRGFKYD